MKRTYIRSAVGFVLVYAAMTLFTGTPRHASAREQTRTVTARVVNASGSGAGIRAERVPGQFTVPEGYVATNFKYHFQDPATGYTSTRLGSSSIYSVTHGRSVREAAANPGFELPPGKYKFVVGGRPGAYGSLSFRLVSTTSESDQVTSLENGQTRRSLEKAHGTFDATYYPMTDVYVSDGDGFKQLKDFEGIEVWNWPSQVVVRFRNGQATSKFALRISGDGYEHTHTSTLIGTLSDGRFTGTETGVTQCQTTVADKPITYKTGTVWTLSGQVDPNGLLVLHGKWQSDFGEIPDIKVDGNGGVQVGTKPNESCAESRSLRTQLHLRLPIGQSPSSRTTTPGIVSQPPATPESPPVWADPVDTDDSRDSIWDNTANDDSRDVVSRPPDVPADDRDQRNEVWNSDNAPGSIGSDHNDTTTGQPSGSRNGDEQEDPKIGDRLSEGKIWFRPPWDEGGAYPMDEREVQDIRERQAQGYRWDKRHGWVNDQRERDIESIADIERRSADTEKRRTRETFDRLSDATKKAKEHKDKAKRHGDLSIMHKVDALGLDSLSREERERLPKADDDIKDHLRGDPTSVRGYQRGIVDKTMSQGAIDKTYTILKGSKVVIDESMNYLESTGGLPGKAISKTYTITSTIAEKASKANADYHAGKTDHLDYDTAVTDGLKEGVTNVIVDEISGELNNRVTNRLLKSRAGKGSRDLIESKVKQAKKAKTRDFLNGQVDSLNPTVLDKAGEAAGEKMKSQLNYGVGRATKPAYDATLKEPVKKAVDWSAGSQEGK